MLGAGYNIYVVEDCCGAISQVAHDAALSRMVQAGAVRLTTIAALLEWQRDWARREHYEALMGILKQQGGAYGSGVEYAYTMVHEAQQSARSPQVGTRFDSAPWVMNTPAIPSGTATKGPLYSARRPAPPCQEAIEDQGAGR